MDQPLTPELLIYGYAHGIFPMAEPEEGDAIYWYAPDPRGILPLDAFHVPKNLAKLIRREPFEVVVDRDFEAVMRACAAPGRGRESTWISEEMIAAYTALYRRGVAHSVECWASGELVGGLYGVALGGAFFGESMFHRTGHASKVALVHLVRRLRKGRFTLLDIQHVTPHLEQFGAVEVSRSDYERQLAMALQTSAVWPSA